MHGLIDDIQKRSIACKTVMANQPAFCLHEALGSLPVCCSLELTFYDLTQKLTGLAEESAPMEAMTGVIQDALSILGADELTGDMRAPSPPKKPPQ